VQRAKLAIGNWKRLYTKWVMLKGFNKEDKDLDEEEKKKLISEKPSFCQRFNRIMSGQTIRNDTWYFGVWLFFNNCMLITSLFVITIMIAFDLNFLDSYFWQIDSFFDFLTLIIMVSSFFIQYETMDVTSKKENLLSEQ